MVEPDLEERVSRRLRVGVAGLGRMGRRHAENVAWRTRGMELVQVMDAVETTARAVGEELDVEWATSFEQLASDARIEAVLIATPTSTHADYIFQAARAGKHIFCEKPISSDLDSTRRAIEVARSAGVHLQIGFHRRFDPDYAAVTQRIRAGELGRVYLFRTSLRDMSGPPAEYLRAAGSFFVDTTIHDFDAARWMVGEISEVSAMGAALSDPAYAESGQIDNAVVTVRFANGALGVIDNSRVAGYGYECSTELMGSSATARIDNHRRVHVNWLTAGSDAVDWVPSFIERYPAAYLLEMENFARSVMDDQPVAVTGEDGLAAFTLCLAAHHSLLKGRPIHLDHEMTADGNRYSTDFAD